MIFVGDTFDCEFRTRGKMQVRCALGARFYMLLFSDNTAIHEGTTEHVCFVVPVHYPSFVKSLSRTGSVKQGVDKLFEFKSIEDRDRMAVYVNALADERYSIIRELLTK
jgi:hypothetical protein